MLPTDNLQRATEVAYIDESYDSDKFVMSALVLPVDRWREAFALVQAHRRLMKEKLGIFTSKEFHATDFVAGRGRLAPKPIPKGLRAMLFRGYLKMLAKLPGAAVISGAWPRQGMSLGDVHAQAFSRIQERLQKRCGVSKGYIVSIVDEGRAAELRKVARRSKVWNPIPSQYGAWEDGSPTKNIPNDRLIEDPFFKASHQSHFLQAADFIAFALLKSEVPPTPYVRKHALHTAYDLLAPLCNPVVSPRDPRRMGIVRT
jgi:hypothetical protein